MVSHRFSPVRSGSGVFRYNFQDGLGIPGVEADWIAVGTVDNVVQILSANYSTNTLTLTDSVSR